MKNLFSQFNDITIILISLSTMLLSGFLLTRATKILRLPNVSGYIWLVFY